MDSFFVEVSLTNMFSHGGGRKTFFGPASLLPAWLVNNLEDAAVFVFVFFLLERRALL